MASKFELSDTTPSAPSGKINVRWQSDTLGNVSGYVDPSSGGGAVSSVFGRTGAVVAVNGDYSAAQITNAVDQTQTYANPAWITSFAWSKITGAPATGVSTVFGRSGAVTAQSGDYSAAQVTNAVDATAAYSNPSWITSLAWSKISGAPTIYTDPLTTKGDLLARGTGTTRLPVGSDGQVLTADSAQSLGVKWAAPGSAPVSSVFTRTGAVTAQTGDYSAAQVTNAVSTLGSYADPAWITSLSWAKITGAPTLYVDPLTTKGDLVARGASTTRLGVGSDGQVLTADSAQTLGVKWATAASAPVSSVFTRTGAVIATAGDYTAAMVTNAVDQTATYANPAWITSLAWSKISGAPSVGSYQTPWLQNINGASFLLNSAGGIGIGTTTSAGGSPIAIQHSNGSGVDTISAQNTDGTGVAGMRYRNDLGDSVAFRVGGSTHGISAYRRLAMFNASTSIDMAFMTGVDVERMRLTKDGYVGIGNDMSVLADSSTSDIRVSIGKTSAGAPMSQLNLVSNSSTSGATLASFAYANYARTGTDKRVACINASLDGAADSGALSFFTWSLGSVAERVKISASGNVGINNDPGGYRFRVRVVSNVNLAMESGIVVPGAVVISTMNDAASANIPLEIRTTDTVFVNNGTERMRITAAGFIQMSLGGVMKTLSVDGSGFVKAT